MGISIEFIWKGPQKSWGSEIRSIYLFVGDSIKDPHRGMDYILRVPEASVDVSNGVTLSFTQQSGGLNRGTYQYLSTDIETLRTLTFRAGHFREVQGNTMTRLPDGKFERDTRFQREDVGILLKVGDIKDGQHYQIVVQDLQATLQEAGPCKQNNNSASPLQRKPPNPLLASVASSSSSSSPHLPMQRDLDLPKRILIARGFAALLSSALAAAIGLVVMTEKREVDMNVVPPMMGSACGTLTSDMDATLIRDLHKNLDNTEAFLNTLFRAGGIVPVRELFDSIMCQVFPDLAREKTAPFVDIVMNSVVELSDYSVEDCEAFAKANQAGVSKAAELPFTNK